MQAENLDDGGRSPHVTATAVTTRTATTHENLETNAKTSQVIYFAVFNFNSVLSSFYVKMSMRF